MFSSTTIASSMTMPTESAKASNESILSQKPMYQMTPNVDTNGVGSEIADNNVAHEHRMPADFAHDDVAEFCRRLHPPARPHRHRPRPLIHPAARDVGILRLERPGDVVHREVLRLEARGIKPDIDLPLPAAQD